MARLTCLSITRKFDDSDERVDWYNEVPVYLKTEAQGHEAIFVFDIPASCKPTERLNSDTSISWQIDIEGKSNMGTFSRTWQVDLESHADNRKSALVVPRALKR